MNFRNSVPHLLVLFSLLIVFYFLGREAETERRIVALDEVIPEEKLQQRPESTETGTFYFGFDRRGRPQEDARQYVPFLNYLDRTTGYRFELRFTPQESTIVDDLGRGVIHFAAVGAGSYLLAHKKYDVISLVRGLNAHNQPRYQSCIVVAPESDIEHIGDLRGKLMAFGGKSSTQGYLIPRIILAENNLSLEDLAGYSFTGSHYKCASEVIAGRANACGMQDTMAMNYAAKNLLRIIYTSKPYPSSGIAANKDVAPEVIEKVKQALIDFQPDGRDKAGLYNWDNTEMPKGFIESRDADYNELRLWAEKFDYLTEVDQ